MSFLQIAMYVISGIALMGIGHLLGSSARYGILAYERCDANPAEVKSAYRFYLLPFLFLGTCVIVRGLYLAGNAYYPEITSAIKPEALLLLAVGILVMFAGHVIALRASQAAARDSRQENPDMRKIYKSYAIPAMLMGVVSIVSGVGVIGLSM